MILSLQPVSGQPLLAISVRLFMPWIGVWHADVDVDLGTIPTTPTGPCLLKIGDQILNGTIDPEATSKLGDFKAHVRVVGGSNGWSTDVKRLPYHMDGGVLLQHVLTTTAAAVKEVVVLANPTERFGIDYVRMEGPASQVLRGRDWHVNFQGVTFVGPRLPASPKPGTLDILDWDGITHRLTAASDEIVIPGTEIIDTRIGTGRATVRTVEQTWGVDGAMVRAWCSAEPPEESNPIAAPIYEAIDHRVQRSYLAPQLYRVVTQDAKGRLVLQAVSLKAGAPDMIPLSPWPGMSGLSATYKLGTEVLVSFINGDPTRPVVGNFKDGKPIELKLDATVSIMAGAPAAAVPVAKADTIVEIIGALKTAIGAAGPGGPAAVTVLEAALLEILPGLPTTKFKAE